MPRKSNTIGIIGLGRFGMNVAKELASSGKSILCIDRDEEKVKEILNYCEYAYVTKDLSKSNLEELGLEIATVDKLFEEFYQSHPDLLFIVEIKNSGELGYKACEILYDTLNKYPGQKNQIVVGTFHDEIEEELKTNYPDLLRGAPTGTAAKFVATQLLKVNLFDNSDFACLQIPMSYDVGIELHLDKATFINRAHRRNIAVQYWTINDPDEMRELIELGCDCIMTDNPILLKQVLEEYR